MYIAFAGCPTGMGFDPKDTIEVEKLAVGTGIWPLRESVDGVVKHTVVPRSLSPVREYLKTQERFRHLFVPTEKTEAIAAIQEAILAYWREAGAREGFSVRAPA
jgi:pyruvate ferredoxin oxidoreductase beta subunit